MRTTTMIALVAMLGVAVGSAAVVAASSTDPLAEGGENDAAYAEDGLVGERECRGLRQGDQDGDGIPNFQDEDFVPPILLKDDDGDGIPNGEDADWEFPERADEDGDGIPNWDDEDFVPRPLRDDDGDGVLNFEDEDWERPRFRHRGR